MSKLEARVRGQYQYLEVRQILEDKCTGGSQFLNARARYFSVEYITRKGSASTEATETICANSFASITCQNLTCSDIITSANNASPIPANLFAACHVASLIIDLGEPYPRTQLRRSLGDNQYIVAPARMSTTSLVIRRYP